MSSLHAQARTYYSDLLPYHNWSHVLSTLQIAKRLHQQLKTSGITTDWQLIEFCLLFHDANYHKDHTKLGFASKEAHSSQLTDELTRQLGYGAAFRKQVRSAIMCTRIFAVARTNEQKIIRLSDASAGMTGNYAQFYKSNQALLWEWRMLFGPLTNDQWKKQTNIVVGRYLRSLLSPVGLSPALHAHFRQSAGRNLARFNREYIATL